MTGDGPHRDDAAAGGGDDPSADAAVSDGSRRADIETVHADPAAAAVVASAVRPDNTDAMTTDHDGDVVTTTIERDSTGGLAASVDDYVVNVDVATQIITTTRQ